MPRSRKPTPSYLPHKQSGRARAVWTDPAGIRHQQLLPVHVPFNPAVDVTGAQPPGSAVSPAES